MSRKAIGKTLLFVAPFLLLGALLYLINHMLQEKYRKITIGRDTTFVTGPTLPDGYIDYLAALNTQFYIPPEKNAAVPLLRTTNLKDSLSATHMAEYIAELKLPPPNTAEQFVDYFVILEEKAKAANPGKYFGTSEFFDRAGNIIDRRVTSPWTADQDPQTADWLKRNSAALTLVIEASKCEGYFFPLKTPENLGTVTEAQLPSLGSFKSRAEALACRSTLRLGNHDFAGWREDFLAQARLGIMLMRAPNVIQWLVGLAITARAYESASSAIGMLSSEEARTILDDIRALPPLPDLVDCLDTSSRLEVIAEISKMARFGPAASDPTAGPPTPASFGFQLPIHFDALLRQHNQLWDRQLAAIRLPTFSQRQAACEALEAECIVASEKAPATSTGAIQRVIYFSIHSARLTKLQDRARQPIRLLQLALLLQIYHADHAAYPPTTADLPDLRDADIDIFADNAKVHYTPSPTGFVIYSIGPNQHDDAGQRITGPAAAKPGAPDDIAIHIPG